MTDCGKLESIKKRSKAIKYTSAFRYACVEKVLENPEKPITVIARSIGINAWTTGDKRLLNKGRFPANKLSEQEVEKVKDTLYEASFADKSPYKVVSTLLDERKYLCSAPTMYRILRNEGANKRRTQNRQEDSVLIRPVAIATQPEEVFNWDITFLPSMMTNF